MDSGFSCTGIILLFMRYIKYLLLAAALSSCGSSVGDLEEGFLMKLQSHADSIAYKLGYGLISGMSTVALSKESQEKLGVMIDSIMHTVGIRTTKDLAILLDTLAGETTNSRLKILLQTIRQSVDSIRDDALGRRTGAMLARIIQNDVLGAGTQLRLQHLINDGVLGPQTEQRIGEIMARLRDTLIGVSTQSSIDSIVARSLARVQGTASEQQGFLKKNITAILWTAGIVVGLLLILAAFLFFRKRKSEKMLEVVTKQIENIPDKSQFDELTKRISANSEKEGVDKDLRVFLAKKVPSATK